MANRMAAERTLAVNEDRYTLIFTNAAFAELEDVLDMSAKEIERRLINSGFSARLLRGFLWAATRKYHATDLPHLDDVAELIDDLGVGLSKAYMILFEAYSEAQPRNSVVKQKDNQEEQETNGRPDDVHQKPEPQDQFNWREFMEQAVQSGIKPFEFWQMTPDETVMWIEGFEHRYDMQGQMMAHFWSIFANSNRKKHSKKVKAKDLWQKRQPDPNAGKSREQIIEEREDTIAHYQATLPPVQPPRKHRGDKRAPSS